MATNPRRTQLIAIDIFHILRKNHLVSRIKMVFELQIRPAVLMLTFQFLIGPVFVNLDATINMGRCEKGGVTRTLVVWVLT